MKVRCLRNCGKYGPLVLPYVYGESMSDLNFISSHEWYSIDSEPELSGYSLTISSEYTVYGMLFYKNELRYLIADDDNMPGFFPADLFEITERYVLLDWEMNVFTIDSEKLYVIGYTELVSNYSQLRDLIDGDSCAVRDFLEYKESLETWRRLE